MSNTTKAPPRSQECPLNFLEGCAEDIWMVMDLCS